MSLPISHLSLQRLEQLDAGLREKALQAPPDHARPVHIAGHRCGWATLAACDALRDSGLVQLTEQGLYLLPDLQPGAALDTALAEVAQVLRDARCLRGWRDELLDVTAGSEHLGVIERAAMRPLGLLTKAVHLNAWTPDGRLWVARRSLSKSTDPGMWDTLVGGLVGSREALEDALVRECGEEAGLDPYQLTQREPLRTVLRMQRRLPEGYQVEDLLTSTCVLDESAAPANRDGEVMEITALPVAEVIDRLEAGEFTLEAALVILEDIRYRSAT